MEKLAAARLVVPVNHWLVLSLLVGTVALGPHFRGAIVPVGLLLEKSMEGRGLDITSHQEQVKELGVFRWAECRLRESPN